MTQQDGTPPGDHTDRSRMDWLRLEQSPVPYKFEWGSTVVKSSAHGAVA